MQIRLLEAISIWESVQMGLPQGAPLTHAHLLEVLYGYGY